MIFAVSSKLASRSGPVTVVHHRYHDRHHRLPSSRTQNRYCRWCHRSDLSNWDCYSDGSSSSVDELWEPGQPSESDFVRQLIHLLQGHYYLGMADFLRQTSPWPEW